MPNPSVVPPSGAGRGRQARLVWGAVVLLAALAYVTLFAFGRGGVFGEQTFSSEGLENVAQLDVYVDVLAIDPVREAMRMQIEVANGPGEHGTHYFGTSTRDVRLRVSDGYAEQDVTIRRGGPMPSTTFEASLQGAVGNYPFDRYALNMILSAADGSAGRSAHAIPLRVTLWEGEPAWSAHVALVRPAKRSAQVSLNFDLRRRTSLIFFACAIYTIIICIAVAAMLVAAMVSLQPTRTEATLIGALAAMVFALPALRNTLPGTPPLGVSADIFIYLWAELAVVISLAVLVVSWVRQGPRR